MKRADVFQGKYLKAEDLVHAVTVTIECTNMEDIKNQQTGKTEQKAVVYFRNKDKGLVINQINWASIEDQWGDETDGWPGRQITLFATTCEMGGKMVACIRIKPGQSAPVAQAEAFVETIKTEPAQDAVPDDDVPF